MCSVSTRPRRSQTTTAGRCICLMNGRRLPNCCKRLPSPLPRQSCAKIDRPIQLQSTASRRITSARSLVAGRQPNITRAPSSSGPSGLGSPGRRSCRRARRRTPRRSARAGAAHSPCRFRLFDLASPKEVRQLRGSQGSFRGLTFSRDGTVLFAGSGDGTIRRWETATGKELDAFATGEGLPMVIGTNYRKAA